MVLGQCKFKHKSLMGSDEEIRSALFLQISTVNQAIALFVHSDGCCIIRWPGPFVTFAFVVSQTVSGCFLLFASLPQFLFFPYLVSVTMTFVPQMVNCHFLLFPLPQSLVFFCMSCFSHHDLALGHCVC